MKSALITLSCLGLSLLNVQAHGSGKHSHKKHESHSHKASKHNKDRDHDHTKLGPNKGRLITSVSPAAEFVVRADRKVQIFFYNSKMKLVAPSSQQVTVITGKRYKPVELTFTEKGKSLISNLAIPTGDKLQTTVVIKANPKSKPVITKFTLD